MATNKTVNKWANDIRRNVDKDSKGISVTAFDVSESHSARGRITIGAGRYVISLNIEQRDDVVALRVFGLANFDNRRRFAEQVMDDLGYPVQRNGDVLETRVEFNRHRVSELAVALAA